MARDRLPGVSFARSQSGGSGSGGPSARFPAGQPRRRRGPPRPASVPGLPRPHPREIATAAAPGPSGPAAAAAGWPHPRAWGVRGLGLSLPGGCHQVPSLGADLHGGRLHPPQLALQRRRGHGPIACAVLPATLHRIGVDKHGDGGHAAAPGQLQVATAPRRVKAQGVHYCVRPRRSQAATMWSSRAKRRPMHSSRARRYPPARAAGPTRPPHPGGNAPPPRPTSRTRTPRPARPAQDRAAPQPFPVPPDPPLQLGRSSYDAERALDLLEGDPHLGDGGVRAVSRRRCPAL